MPEPLIIRPGTEPTNPQISSKPEEPSTPTAPSSNTQPGFDASKIYPEPTATIPAQPTNSASHLGSSAVSNTYSSARSPLVINDDYAAFRFSNGFSVGGRIFWWEILVGIIASLTLSMIPKFVANYHNLTLSRASLIFTQLVAFYVAIKVATWVLDSEACPLSIWVATFVTLVLGALGVIASFMFNSWAVVSLSKNTSIWGWLGQHHGSGLLIIVASAIFAFALSYYATKLNYGITFYIFSKLRSAKLIKTLTLILTVLAVGGTIFWQYNAWHKLDNSIKSRNSIYQSSRQ